MLVMLTCAMGIGPLINFALGSVSVVIIDDLGITAGQYGLISTVCFTVAALASMYAGRLTDQISDRAQIIVIFGGSALAFAMAWATFSYAWLIFTIAVSGLTQAMGNPTTNRLSGRYAPTGKQAGWIGIKQSGQQAAQLAAGLFFPPLTLVLGWRGAAGVLGILAIVLGAWAWTLVPRRDPIVRAAPTSGVKIRARLPVRVYFFAAQALVGSMGLTATNVFLPLFSVRDIGFPVILGGIVVAVVGIVGVTSRIFWARSMMAGRGANNLLVILAAGAIVGSLCLVGASVWTSAALLWTGTVLHGAMALGVNVVVMAGVMRVIGSSMIGTATGVVSLGLYTGIAAGPLLMGGVLDTTGSFTVGWAVVAGINLVGLLIAVGLRLRSGP